jgi:hypothetical protein
VTKAEWLAATDPLPMLATLQAAGKASERKLRLFACHCCYHVFESHGSFEGEAEDAIMMAERFADGEATLDDLIREREAFLHDFDPATFILQAMRHGVTPAMATPMTADEAARVIAGIAEYFANAAPARVQAHQCDVLRDLFGNPFRLPPAIDPSWLTWDGGTAVRLAAAAYEERDPFSGELDRSRLAVRADALEEAGCDDKDVLDHLREQGGVHVRGCWAVDLLLRKA